MKPKNITVISGDFILYEWITVPCCDYIGLRGFKIYNKYTYKYSESILTVVTFSGITWSKVGPKSTPKVNFCLSSSGENLIVFWHLADV